MLSDGLPGSLPTSDVWGSGLFVFSFMSAPVIHAVMCGTSGKPGRRVWWVGMSVGCCEGRSEVAESTTVEPSMWPSSSVIAGVLADVSVESVARKVARCSFTLSRSDSVSVLESDGETVTYPGAANRPTTSRATMFPEVMAWPEAGADG